MRISNKDSRNLQFAMVMINAFLVLLFVVVNVPMAKTAAGEGECPKDWVKDPTSGYCYFVSTEMASHRSAMTACTKLKAYLASVKSIKEGDILVQQLLQRRSHCKQHENCYEFWFGLHKSQGKWFWMDGTRNTVQLWYPKNPVGGGGDCALISIEDNSEGYSGSWKNEKCDKLRKYICKTYCPAGFFYSLEAHKCYRIISEKLSWEEAWEKCPQINAFANLIIISSETENDNAANYVKTQLKDPYFCADTRRKAVFWVGAKRSNPGNCRSPIVWRSSPAVQEEIPMKYTHWNVKEPKCQQGVDTCVSMEKESGFKWSERDCEAIKCSLCELDPEKMRTKLL